MHPIGHAQRSSYAIVVWTAGRHRLACRKEYWPHLNVMDAGIERKKPWRKAPLKPERQPMVLFLRNITGWMTVSILWTLPIAAVDFS